MNKVSIIVVAAILATPASGQDATGAPAAKHGHHRRHHTRHPAGPEVVTPTEAPAAIVPGAVSPMQARPVPAAAPVPAQPSPVQRTLVVTEPIHGPAVPAQAPAPPPEGLSRAPEGLSRAYTELSRDLAAKPPGSPYKGDQAAAAQTGDRAPGYALALWGAIMSILAFTGLVAILCLQAWARREPPGPTRRRRR